MLKNRKMHGWIILLIVLMAAALVLTGCGGKEKATGSAPAEPVKEDVKFPTQPVSLVVGFGVGGGVDGAARAIQPELEKALGASVQVVNKAGSSGIIAATEVAKAKPDGHTLLVSNNPIVNNIKIFATDKSELKSMDQLIPIASWMNGDGNAFVVPKDSPYKTMEDFVKANKDKEFSVAVSGGIGATGHIAFLQIGKAYDLKMRFVPYASSAEGIAAVMGKHIDAGIFSISGESVSQDNVTFLGVTTEKSHGGVPSFAEMGHPEVTIYFMVGAFGPADMDPRVVEILSDAFKKAYDGDQYQTWAKNGDKPIGRFLDYKEWKSTMDTFEKNTSWSVDVIKEAQAKEKK